MTGFWIGAALLGAVAVAFLVIPLWLDRGRSGQWSGSGLAAALAVLPVAVLLYLNVTTYDENAGGPPAEQVDVVRQLAERLVDNPEDPQGWQMLGRSYMTLGEYRLARDAYAEAWERTAEPDNALKLGFGEALIYTDPASIRSQAGDLIEQVLASEPTNQRALWWGGVVASERNQPDVARSRWTTLLRYNPPAEIADLIRRQLATLPGEGPAAPTAGPSPVAGPALTLNVSVAPDMPLDALGANSYVFIFARSPGGGPPIAGARHPISALPGTFSLSDADAIIAGRSLSAFPELAIIARISVSGDPIEQPGDLFAEATYRQGGPATIELVIDQVVGAD